MVRIYLFLCERGNLEMEDENATFASRDLVYLSFMYMNEPISLKAQDDRNLMGRFQENNKPYFTHLIP